MVTAISIASMLVGIAVKLPIVVVLLLYAVAAALVFGDGDADPTIIAHALMQGSDSVAMVVLSFFVPTDEIMNRGGLTKRTVAFYNIFIGHVRSGLGYVMVLTCLMFTSLISSATAVRTMLGTILIPTMANFDYNRKKTVALTAGTNLVTSIMPPSVPMVIHGIAAGVPVKSLFAGDIAPVVYLTIIASAMWFFVSYEKSVVPNMEIVSKLAPEKAIRITFAGLWTPLLPMIIPVGLYSDYFIATEADVIVCVYAILIGLSVYRKMKIKGLMKVFVASTKMPAMVMFLAAAANCATYFMMISRVPQMVTSGLEGLVEKPTFLMLVLVYVIVVMGLAMDAVPSVLILTPTMLLLTKVAGIDSVYFGTVFVLTNVLSLMSPPVGPVLNVACVTGKVKMNKIILPIIPYFIARTILCFLLALALALVEVPLRWLRG